MATVIGRLEDIEGKILDLSGESRSIGLGLIAIAWAIVHHADAEWTGSSKAEEDKK